MAPEMDSEEWGPEDISGPADVFSFGMMLWEMAAEQTPFAKFSGERAIFQVRQAIVTGKMPDLPTNITPEMSDLITACWDPVPDQRPRFDEIVNQPSVLLFEDADENVYDGYCSDLIETKYRV
jgi:mitogen-activated protein kinase kinase kinase 9